ncbi:hypothetical protein EsH8_X_000277 [Colletotrichum jinshuiense]
MLHVATLGGRARWPGWRLPTEITLILRRPASSRPQRQNTKYHRPMNPAKTYSPRRPTQPLPSSLASGTLETADAIFKARRIPLLASGVVALGLGIYLSLLASSIYSSPCSHGSTPAPDAVPTGRPNVFTKESARKFDQSLDGSEWLMGITSLRQKLAAEASGHVLEVAMGTGRNLSFYDWSNVVQPQSTSTPSAVAQLTAAPRASTEICKPTHTPIISFTGVDISGEMLGIAIEKLAKAIPDLANVEPKVKKRTSPSQNQGDGGVFSYLSDRLRIVRSDVHDCIPPPIQQSSSSPKYDTIIQTFGLCSFGQPEHVVKNLASMVKPNTGKIILVEHGRGWWGVVNGLLDRSATSHFQKYGCWWNRDIAEIIENAAKSTPGLEVVKIEREFYHLGTTLWVELRMASPGAS